MGVGRVRRPGLAIAGSLRPEAALVVANVLFLLALAFGGVLVPIGDLPAPLAAVAGVLPVGALAEAFGAALGDGATSRRRSASSWSGRRWR